MLTSMNRLIVIPLSYLRRLDSLKYTSIAALVSMAYLVVLVVYNFVKGETKAGRGPIRVGQWAGAIPTLSSLPVIVFAFTCHQNVCPTTCSGFGFTVPNSVSRCFPFLMKSPTTVTSARRALSLPALAAQPPPTFSLLSRAIYHSATVSVETSLACTRRVSMLPLGEQPLSCSLSFLIPSSATPAELPLTRFSNGGPSRKPTALRAPRIGIPCWARGVIAFPSR